MVENMTSTKRTKTDAYCDWMKMQRIDAKLYKVKRDDFRKELEIIPSM
jgi:hypothetical protein